MSEDAAIPLRRKQYRGFGDQLYHQTPSWVRTDAIFHVRISLEFGSAVSLIEPSLAQPLLESVEFYQKQQRWWPHVFLLMPDHLHALVRFGMLHGLRKTVSDWKRFHACKLGIPWQENFFDHRLRGHDAQWRAKAQYIARNPVASGLCKSEADWPWVYHAPLTSIETRLGSSEF